MQLQQFLEILGRTVDANADPATPAIQPKNTLSEARGNEYVCSSGSANIASTARHPTFQE